VTDDLEQRLRQLGDAPIDPQISRAHHAAMAEAAIHRASPRFGWKAVAAAAIAGFLAGSTGLAAAGALPDPAQDVAHDVLDVVGIGVPRSTEGCPDGKSYRNHGEYVSAVEAAGGDVEAASHSSCGKPTHGNGKAKGAGKEDSAPRADTDGDPCTGPPPWAGAHLTPEERDAAKAERVAACGADDDPEETEATEDDTEVDQQREAPAAPEATTTTTEVPATTTSTTEPDTTTTTTGS
jgi:hypothetical protein